MPVTRQVVRPVAAVATGLLLFGAGLATGAQVRPPAAPTAVDEALSVIGQRAVSGPSSVALDDAAIEGALDALDDPWASFYPAAQGSQLTGTLDGSYSGTGIWLRRAGAGAAAPTVVTSVLASSPADVAGALVGDQLVAVDGRPVAALPLAEVVAELRGAVGSAVTLTVQRHDLPVTLDLVRREVRTSDVTVHVSADVLEVGIAHFSRGVSEQVAAAMAAHPGTSLLLDLRGNPGGLLDEAVRTASLLLDGGPVVRYAERATATRVIAASPGGDTRTPVVVLVDAASASAAEVLAGALQERGRAVLVGTPTYGKGSVQQPVTLSGGGALTLTVGHYETPSGRRLDGVGLQPDVEVATGSGPKAAVDRALTILAGLLADSGGGG